ncbi:MAG: hypothetical protein FWD31_03320 [Planctomycetaceae bacterium]|nr:hypothetical protein [Planctomycetaceae bacterium]
MKKLFFVIVLCSLATGFVVGQTPELLPWEISDDKPDIDVILRDKEFVRLYEQMSGQKLSRDALLPTQLSSQPVAEVFNVAPMSVPKQDASRQLVDIAMQQLAQLDCRKSLLIQNLRNAETCGYRAVKPSSADAGPQTDFESRRYVSSPSCFHWAIHGDGFFVLRKLREEPSDADDLFYTRAGRFGPTDDRKLCLKHDGETYLLQPEVEIASAVDERDVSAWQLARFACPERLHRIDGVLFQREAEHDGEEPEWFHPSEASGTTIRIREYEASNVDFNETVQIYRALHRMQSAILETAFPFDAPAH